MRPVRYAECAILAGAWLLAGCELSAPTEAGPSVQFDLYAEADWSQAENMGPAINSAANEQNATLSRDQLSLYFTSDRTGGEGALDIWVARRATRDSPWSPAVNLGAIINTSSADFAPNLSVDGHLLFFASNRPGGQGGNDLYVSRRSNPNDDFGWEVPVNLGTHVNTPDAENAPVFLQSSEDGATNLYFNRGVLAALAADIYTVAITRGGETLGPAVLVSELSVVGANDAAVSIRKDGREIFFWSTRPGGQGAADVWAATRQSKHDPWSAPVNPGAPLNSSSAEVTPSLSHDASTIVFGSNRPGGLGGNDIWVATRVRN